MNRIDELFRQKTGNILSVYFTAGFPGRDDTVQLITELENAGVDLIEIGMPFSDPLADGPVIQQSSTIALENGMSLPLLFEQLKDIRTQVKIPLVLMGYMNPVMQFGIDNFCRNAEACGIDGLILPDMPPEVYAKQYKDLFEKYGLHHILLITPRTSDERIRYIDSLSNGFVYAVSSSSTTGSKGNDVSEQQKYFQRISSLKLKNPVMIGFGISERSQFENACKYASGAIIGSAFIRSLSQTGKGLDEMINLFIAQIKSDY